MNGTIITGSVRSGTTLALRILCPNLTQKEIHSGNINEPHLLSKLIVNGDIERALLVLPLAILNKHRLIKSPHIAFLLPYVKPRYKVVATFRDLRMVIPSMFHHPIVPRLDLSNDPYWVTYTQNIVLPSDPVEKAVLAVENYYTSLAMYKGPIEIWNYGFWEEWRVLNYEISHLYGIEYDVSNPVKRDLEHGKLFSNSAFSIDIWSKFCDEFGVTTIQDQAVQNANERIRQAFDKHGLKIKTLDDK